MWFQQDSQMYNHYGEGKVSFKPQINWPLKLYEQYFKTLSQTISLWISAQQSEVKMNNLTIICFYDEHTCKETYQSALKTNSTNKQM